MKRSGKFYRKNEAEVMGSLGLKPTKNSGSGWIEKEDGQSEHVICQLKSTDAQSISIRKQDLDTLEYNAEVVHKIPVFAIQYLTNNDVYLVMRPEVLEDLARYLKTGHHSTNNSLAGFCGVDPSISHTDNTCKHVVQKIASCSSARAEFAAALEQSYRRKEKSAL